MATCRDRDLPPEIRRAVRRGRISRGEACAAVRGEVPVATSGSLAAREAVPVASPAGPSPACKPILCRNPQNGELIWRRDGNCPTGWLKEVSDRLAGATRQIVETNRDGDLLPPREGEEKLW